MENTPFEKFPPPMRVAASEGTKGLQSSAEQVETRVELKNEKLEVVYSGLPINIYLGDKLLQIIDVRNDDRWNAEYLLIDPLTFDQTNPTKGFKGIREGEPFIVGRENPLRFEFSITVSRAHLKVELRNGKLILEDVGSTNGTVIELQRSPKIKKEAEREFSAEAKRTIAQFRHYIANHQAEIERELQQGRNLAEIFYHDFYNSNQDHVKYKENDPSFKELALHYGEDMEEMMQSLRSQEGIAVLPHPYWVWCMVNGGYRQEALRNNKLGRFYLNLKPEFVGEVFAQLVRESRAAGLHIGAKIPRVASASALNRMDKMVVYFEADEEEQALRVLEAVYRKAPSVFDETGTPRFTAALKDSKGEFLQGVGFGEEPMRANESFGTVRAAILSEVYYDAKRSGVSLLDSIFDFEGSFKRACTAMHVDPQNPAFNISSGKVSQFQKIRGRTNGSK